jgi:hypothetical protein
MDENSVLFHQSCLNLSLKKSGHFISAFPTKIVFGLCSPLGYKLSKYFEFELYELCQLYFAIFDLVKYFASNIAFEKRLILSKLQQNYYLVPKVLYINNEPHNVGVLGIELLKDNNESEISFELFFTDNELNDFIYSLIKTIPASLCLTSTELLLFLKASTQNTKDIKLLQTEKNAESFLQRVSKDLKEDISEVLRYNYTIFLSYNCEIILLFHKFETLFNKELRSNNIEIIISKN